jgi:hypothetical protein
MQDLFVAPRILHNSCFGQVEDLFLNVSFNKSVPSFFFVFNRVKLSLVIAVYIFYHTNPVIDDTNRTAVHCSLYTSAAVVAANYDMTDLERVDCEIKHTEQV